MISLLIIVVAGLILAIVRLPKLFDEGLQPFWKKASQWFLYTVLLSMLPILFDYTITYAKGNGAAPPVIDVIKHGELCLIATAISCVAIGELAGVRSEGRASRMYLFWLCLVSGVCSVALYVIIRSIATEQTAHFLSYVSGVILLSSAIISTVTVAVPELPAKGGKDA